jgi:hypothetical protein
MSALPHKPTPFSVAASDVSKPEDPGLIVSTVKYWLRKEQREVQADILATTRVSVLPKNAGEVSKRGFFGKVFDRHVRGTLLMTQDSCLR